MPPWRPNFADNETHRSLCPTRTDDRRRCAQACAGSRTDQARRSALPRSEVHLALRPVYVGQHGPPDSATQDGHRKLLEMGVEMGAGQA